MEILVWWASPSHMLLTNQVRCWIFMLVYQHLLGMNKFPIGMTPRPFGSWRGWPTSRPMVSAELAVMWVSGPTDDYYSTSLAKHYEALLCKSLRHSGSNRELTGWSCTGILYSMSWSSKSGVKPAWTGVTTRVAVYITHARVHPTVFAIWPVVSFPGWGLGIRLFDQLDKPRADVMTDIDSMNQQKLPSLELLWERPSHQSLWQTNNAISPKWNVFSEIHTIHIFKNLQKKNKKNCMSPHFGHINHCKPTAQCAEA